LALGAIATAGFDPAWFPPAASTGAIVGVVQKPNVSSDPWERVKSRLEHWRFAAGLGDNHASAVGCGMTDDYRRLVVSAGTSGTINLACPKDIPLPADGASMRFEFYDRGVFLLRMLADCGAWYSRFFQTYAGPLSSQLEQLNALTLDVALPEIRRVLHDDVRHFETFPPSWEHSSLGLRTACTQFSIAVELLIRVAGMADEVKRSGRWTVDTYVLTGGLSQSRLFQQFFRAGLEVLVPGSQVKVSGRTGPLRFKTSAYGALVNAELAKLGSLDKVFADTARFPLLDCAALDPLRSAQADYLMRAAGLALI
jgi:sugar (pentulose or hexulose) kinase